MKTTILILMLIATGCQAVEPDAATLPGEELRYLYEEEKLARDVYDHFEVLYGITPYIHISDSEQSHFERMENLMIELGIIGEEEVIRTEPGTFVDAELQTLYDGFIEQGEVSLIEALMASAYIEEKDITDLKALADVTTDTRIKETLEYLVEASKNHLRAFNRNLATRDVIYQPVLLDQRFFDEIISGRNGNCCKKS